MAIGTAAAIGLGVAGVGSVLSSRSSNSASRRAAETSQDNNTANIAFAREGRNMATQRLDPFVNRGNVAGNQINALLGLGGSQMATAPATAGTQPNALSQFTGPTGGAGSPYGVADGYGSWGNFTSGSGGFNPFEGFNPAAFGDVSPQVGGGPNYGGNPNANPGNPSTYSTTGGTAQPTNTATPTGGAVATGQTAQGAAEDAFDIFRNSTGYQFRLGEGLDAVNSAYAGAGTLQSGAAMRGITEYGQNFASNEFGNYLNALGAQQSVGAGAASSLAGVGQNYASQVINSNNMNAANQMNAQLSRQNTFANVLGTIGGGLMGGFGG